MVIENIIENASKYSEDRSRVIVSVKRTDTHIQVSVADNGVGIDPADRHQLFQRFGRIENPLSDTVGGTGLGLYWSKQVVDLHGGEITHRANKPKGSIFTLTLPIRNETVKNVTENS